MSVARGIADCYSCGYSGSYMLEKGGSRMLVVKTEYYFKSCGP